MRHYQRCVADSSRRAKWTGCRGPAFCSCAGLAALWSPDRAYVGAARPAVPREVGPVSVVAGGGAIQIRQVSAAPPHALPSGRCLCAAHVGAVSGFCRGKSGAPSAFAQGGWECSPVLQMPVRDSCAGSERFLQVEFGRCQLLHLEVESAPLPGRDLHAAQVRVVSAFCRQNLGHHQPLHVRDGEFPLGDCYYPKQPPSGSPTLAPLTAPALLRLGR